MKHLVHSDAKVRDSGFLAATRGTSFGPSTRPNHFTPSVGPSSSQPSTFGSGSKDSKLKKVLKEIFSTCTYAATQTNEVNKKIDDVRCHPGMPVVEILAPPVFPPLSDSSEERHGPFLLDDDETLDECYSTIHRRATRTGYMASTHRSVRAPIESTEEEQDPRGKCVSPRKVMTMMMMTDENEEEDSKGDSIGGGWSP